MNYHEIRKDDMLNGDGLRVTLFVSGCSHKCKECQNPQTWNKNSGILFDDNAKNELFNELKNDYIDGVTFSGGDPLHESNRHNIFLLCSEIKELFPNKTIWIYSGYKWEEIMQSRELTKAIILADVLVDGRFENDKADVNYPWAGSTNQRIIDIRKSLEKNKIMLWLG